MTSSSVLFSRQSPLILALLFAGFLGLIVLVAAALPELPQIQPEGMSVPISPSDVMKFPSSLEDVKALAWVLSRHSEHHLAHVLLLYCMAYLWKQTFAVPGSALLNILGGALFGYWAFPIVCVMTAIGSTMCFLLSGYFGRQLLERYAKERLAHFRGLVQENHQNLFLFMMGLRIIPLTPNWMINIASPHVGVPWFLLFFSAFFGLMPYNFLFVQAGQIINRLQSTGDIVDTTTVLQFLLVGGLTIGLSVLKKAPAKTAKKD